MKHMYDDYVDSLIICKKKKTDKVKGSAILGDLVLDITTEGKIVNLEIKHFSKFLKKMKMPMEVEDLLSATMSITYKADSILILVYLKFEGGEEQRLPLWIATQSPQMAEA